MSTQALQNMLAKGMDNALLRFGLGKAYLDNSEWAQAAEHLQRCVEFDRHYSAAWKLLGQALQRQQLLEEARAAWQQGITAAQHKGDKQAEKEMTVFVKRLDKQVKTAD